jgi:hypothetical protein
VAEGRALRSHDNRIGIIYPGRLVSTLALVQGEHEIRGADFLASRNLFSSHGKEDFVFWGTFTTARPEAARSEALN